MTSIYLILVYSLFVDAALRIPSASHSWTKPLPPPVDLKSQLKDTEDRLRKKESELKDLEDFLHSSLLSSQGII